MYYKCKIYPTSAIVYIREEYFDVIVNYLSSFKDSISVLEYLTDDEVKLETNNCFIELNSVR